MFEVKKTSSKSAEYFIINSDNPMQVMRFTEMEELAELHMVLSEYLAGQKMGEFIGSEQAQQIAREQGFDIPANTLTNAYRRGTIQAAYKKRGRWYMPKAAFLLWFDEWKAKQPTAQNS